jgi:hypothetical protein
LNDSDPDGDPLTVSEVTQGSMGSVVITGPGLNYSPNPDFFGGDQFTYTVVDGQGGSATATVLIDVTNANDPPTADAQAVGTTPGNPVAVTLTGSDADGDALSFVIMTMPANGTLSGSAPNVTYTPDPGFSGTDAFGFVANDGGVDSAEANVTISVDNGTAPIIGLYNPAPSALVNSLSQIEVNFDESVSGVAAGDLSVNGSASTAVSGSGSGPYVFTGFASPSDGVVSVSFGSGAVVDAFSNTFSGDAWSYTLDTAVPTVSIGAPSVSDTNSGPVTFAVTYTGADTVNLLDGDVTLNATGLAAGTATVTNGTTSTPTVTVSGITGDGTLGISIAAGKGSDTSGNTDAGAGPSATFNVDNTAPTVSIGAPSVSDTNSGPVTFAVTYTGADTVNLLDGDVTLNATGSAAGTATVSNGTTSTPTVTVSGITGDGTLGISIAAGKGLDTSGNTDAGAGPSATFNVDNTAPTVSIGAPSVSDTNSGPVTFAVTYTGADTVNLLDGDVTLNATGSANGSATVSDGTTSTPTVTVSGITGDGTLGISIAAGKSVDTVGNADAGTGASATFNVDNAQPTVAIVAVATGTTIDVTFSEEADATSGQTPANYTLSGTGQGSMPANPTSAVKAGNVVTLTFTGEMFIGGDLTITVSNVTDLAGNVVNPASNSGTHVGGGIGTAPSVVSATRLDAATIEIVFDEAMAQATVENTASYTIAGPVNVTLATLQPDGVTVLLTVDADPANRKVSVQTTVTDLAGNALPAKWTSAKL